MLSWWTVPAVHDKYDAILADGAIRSGKTVCMSLSFVLWAMTKFNECDFAICGKTVGSCKRNVIKPLRRMLRNRYKIVFKRSDNILEISKGNKTNYFYIFGGKDESSQDLIQGITLAGVLLDEVALMPQSFVDQAVGRCSIEGAKLWFNCNPENPRHWFYKEWMKNIVEKKVLHLHFTMDDNLTLSKQTKERYYNRFSGTFFRRFIMGEWVVAEGLVYQNYHDSMIDKLYKGDGTELRGEWYVSIDHGTVNPCSMGLWCVMADRAIRVDECYFDSRKEHYQRTDEEHYTALKELVGNQYIRYIICDPAAASFITTIRRHNEYRVRPAVNEVINGIRITSELLKSGRAVISEKCKNSQEEFGLYRWGPADTKGKDTVIKENDHAMDDIRYFCNTILAREYRWCDWRLRG